MVTRCTAIPPGLPGRPVARLSYGTTNMVALRQVNFYIGVSDPMTDILIERDFPADRIYTIYNGIDFKTPIQTVPKEEFLKSVGMEWEPGDVIAGIAVRLSVRRATLLQAMKIACAQSPASSCSSAATARTVKAGGHGQRAGALGEGVLCRVAQRRELLLQRH
ncbi:MAG: hypothetical protein ACLRSY_02650 [Acutalibacter sp.]